MNVNDNILKAIVVATVFQSLLIILLEVKSYYSQKQYIEFLEARTAMLFEDEPDLSFEAIQELDSRNNTTFI
jgi:hypothetical protein